MISLLRFFPEKKEEERRENSYLTGTLYTTIINFKYARIMGFI